MIYIISNGARYSDHRLLFIEVDSFTPATDISRALLRASARRGTKHAIVGDAQQISWWSNGPGAYAPDAMKLADWEDAQPVEEWERDIHDFPEGV